MNPVVGTIVRRRVVKVFEPVEISGELREQILDAARHAPSSFNSQPYKFYWVQSEANKAAVARLCLGQKPAETASALVVAVADLGSLSATSQDQLEWMRSSDFSEEKIHDFERTAKIGRILFMPGAIRNVCCRKTHPLPLAKSGKGDGETATLPTGVIPMGDEEHITGLPESDDCRRSPGNEHLPVGRIR